MERIKRIRVCEDILFIYTVFRGILATSAEFGNFERDGFSGETLQCAILQGMVYILSYVEQEAQDATAVVNQCCQYENEAKENGARHITDKKIQAAISATERRAPPCLCYYQQE